MQVKQRATKNASRAADDVVRACVLLLLLQITQRIVARADKGLAPASYPPAADDPQLAQTSGYSHYVRRQSMNL